MSRLAEQEYSGFGLRFHYPGDWELSEEMSDEQVSITISSPETAFWSVTVLRDRPDAQSPLRAALLAYTEEYDAPDITETEISLAGQPVTTIEVEFVYLELINTARLSALETPRFTLLLLTQFCDADESDQQRVLTSISDSLVLEE
ncbi:MAG: hypothetical protein KF861_02405 [Planctomycetaceae bacterium]|nr:hypothetical protein [Planctomycetaceae bacterium]